MTRIRTLAAAALLAALTLLPLGTAAAQISDNPVDNAAQCLEAAWTRNVRCQQTSRIGVGFLCALRWEAESLLCILGGLADVR